MNKKEKIIAIIALLMIAPLSFGFANTVWVIDSTPIVKADLSDSQVREISSILKFKPVNHERVYIKYCPGALQAAPSLYVFIENIITEEDFLSRFSGVIEEASNYIDYGYLNGSIPLSNYDIEVFQLERIPKDYMCGLSFFDKGESLTAMFTLSGSIPELKPIYRYFFYYDSIKPLLHNWIFIIPFSIELILVIFLVGSICIRFIRNRRDLPV